METALVFIATFIAVFGTIVYRTKIVHRHVWSPWSDWMTCRDSNYRSIENGVWFKRVRYCTECVKTVNQIVGHHQCRSYVPEYNDKYDKGLPCEHKAVMLAPLDTKLYIANLEKELLQ